MPAGCVDTTPPEAKEGFVAKWTSDEWQYIENHIGKTVYSTAQKNPWKLVSLHNSRRLHINKARERA
ncbi:hypothetical protein MZA97_07485 [Haemophilus influenzae]|nr:hypothetical protein [Haemophilus influenzae]